MAKFVVLFTSDSDWEVKPLEATDFDAALVEAEGKFSLLPGQRGKTVLNEEMSVHLMAALEDGFNAG